MPKRMWELLSARQYAPNIMKLLQPAAHPYFHSPAATKTDRVEYPPLLMRVSNRRLAVYVLLFLALLTFVVVSRKYIWLYATRKLAPAPARAAFGLVFFGQQERGYGAVRFRDNPQLVASVCAVGAQEPETLL